MTKIEVFKNNTKNYLKKELIGQGSFSDVFLVEEEETQHK